MKKLIFLLSAVLGLPVFVVGQNPSPPQPAPDATTIGIKLLQPPVSVGGLTIQQNGAAAPTGLTYFYWVVARFSVGNGSPAGPIQGNNAAATLNSSNYFTVFWDAAPGATGYDVLRTTSPSMPSGACACAVASNTSALSANDQSNSLSAYTVSTFDPNSLHLYLDNEAQSAGVSHLILRQGPAGTLICDLSTGCPGASGIVLQTNGTNNTNQALLNLAAGTNISLSNSAGTTTISATGGGSGNVSTAPAAAQAIVQPSAGGNTPGTDFSANSFDQVRYATDFQFIQSPSGSISIGANTVTINAVRGISSYSASPGNHGLYYSHYLRIAGTGTPESVLITATTCIGASTGTCTVTFTAANSHSSGYTVSNATGGWQEAIVDCAWPPVVSPLLNPENGCKVVGGSFSGNANYIFYAPLDADWMFAAPGTLILDGQGSIVQCDTPGTNCFALGTGAATHENPFDVILENFVITPLAGMGRTANGTTRAIYDGGQGNVIYNNSIPYATASDFFDYGIYVDGDQKVTIEHNFANTDNGPAMKCDATWCGAFIYGSALHSQALGRIIDNDITMECAGNGIEWVSGNGVSIEGNIFQDWGQYGILYGPGLVDMTDLGGNYFEAGCPDPTMGASGYMAVNGIAYWGNSRFQASAMDHGNGGSVTLSNTGATTYAYYVVGNQSGNQSRPFFIGNAFTNGSTSFTGYFKPFGATTYDVLRTGPLLNDGTETAPYGTGNWSVATAISCSSSPCTFTESFASLGSYTVAPGYTPTFAQMPYWPGAAYYMGHTNASVPIIYEGVEPAGPLVANSLTSGGNLYQAEFAVNATAAPGNFPTGVVAFYRGPSQESAQNSSGATGSTITQVSNGSPLHLQTGIYNAGLTAITSNESLIFQTYDADNAKTLATGGHQRALESGDAGIGYDAGPTHMGTMCGAGGCTWYVGHIFDGGTSAKLGLSPTALTAFVPAGTAPVAFASLPACASGTEGLSNAVSDSTTNTWGATITGSGSDHVQAYCDGTNWTVAAK